MVQKFRLHTLFYVSLFQILKEYLENAKASNSRSEMVCIIFFFSWMFLKLSFLTMRMTGKLEVDWILYELNFHTSSFVEKFQLLYGGSTVYVNLFWNSSYGALTKIRSHYPFPFRSRTKRENFLKFFNFLKCTRREGLTKISVKYLEEVYYFAEVET